jgi:hypothetical protein
MVLRKGDSKRRWLYSYREPSETLMGAVLESARVLGGQRSRLDLQLICTALY